MVERLTSAQVATRAGHALHKIGRWGQRGITMVTFRETEALSIIAALAGVSPLPLNQEIPEGDEK